uniref:Uncharacterized protein n=1 Tax=Rhizophora mucronata TaxID=61149 RepID=A0A2P2LKI0_RHIMU
MSPFNTIAKQSHQILMPYTSNCFNFNLKLLLSLSPVVEQIFNSNFGIILQNATVNDPVAAFTNHILISKPIGGDLKLPESVPVAPPQMRNFRHRNGRNRLITGARARPVLPAAMTQSTGSFRVRNPMTFPNINVNSISPANRTGLLIMLQKRGRLGLCDWVRVRHFCIRSRVGRVYQDLLDFLGNIRDRGVVNRSLDRGQSTVLVGLVAF